jgi:hypothetical protein
LTRLERYELDVFEDESAPVENTEPAAKAKAAAPHGNDDALARAASRSRRQAVAARLTLFDAANESLLDELRGVDVETLSEDEARQLLLNLRNRVV